MRVSEQLGRLFRVRRQTILRRSSTRVPRQPKPSVSVTRLSNANVSAVAAYMPNARAIAQMEGFLREGRLGVLASVNGEAVGHAWATVAVGEPLVVNGYFQLPADSALMALRT